MWCECTLKADKAEISQKEKQGSPNFQVGTILLFCSEPKVPPWLGSDPGLSFYHVFWCTGQSGMQEPCACWSPHQLVKLAPVTQDCLAHGGQDLALSAQVRCPFSLRNISKALGTCRDHRDPAIEDHSYCGVDSEPGEEMDKAIPCNLFSTVCGQMALWGLI